MHIADDFNIFIPYVRFYYQLQGHLRLAHEREKAAAYILKINIVPI